MEIILREDIEKLGRRGEIVKVADGYARNFLLPRKLAVVATDANKKIIGQERQAWLKREAKLESEAQELAKLLSSITLEIAQRAGGDGTLFGSVTTQAISDALQKQGYTVERKKILLEDPIKRVGEYKVPIRLHRNVTVEIGLRVVPEEV
jgi:large subunit ribosomal protein L9